MKRWTAAALVWIGLAAAGAAQVRVVKSMGAVAQLDMAGFSSPPSGPGALFRRTLEADLIRSGWFAVVQGGRAEFSVQGDVGESGAGLRARCAAFDVAQRACRISRTYTGAASEARALAHRACDEIVQALTGRKGMAASRILLVGNRTGNKEVYLCDADGQNLRQVTRDGSIAQSPKWAADGQRFVYTSFRAQFPDVYLVNLRTGDRRCLAHFPGLNTSAALSPDGRDVALILSKDGNPELYTMSLDGQRLTRLTRTRRAGESSPAWSPDGRRLAYVSDVSGAPHLYLLERAGGPSRRLTSYGSQNVDPDWGPAGEIAYSSLVGGRYQVWLMNPDTQEARPVTPADADYEDPSWAADGRHLVCVRTAGYRSRIFSVDTQTGRLLGLLPDSEKGDWFAPDWSK